VALRIKACPEGLLFEVQAALLRSIAERHDGKVWVESVLGQGSSFRLRIPFSSPDGSNKKLK
jgi:light-regulated signal transduction histidine kinase (bacteriophytochrome)